MFIDCSQMALLKKFINKKLRELYKDVDEKVEHTLDTTSLENWKLIYNKLTN